MIFHPERGRGCCPVRAKGGRYHEGARSGVKAQEEHVPVGSSVQLTHARKEIFNIYEPPTPLQLEHG